MPTSYSEARCELDKAAIKARKYVDTEEVALGDAIGRVSACDYHSPISTPEFDTSAMDGYAIRSESTRLASPESPVFFRVVGTVAAGDGPLMFPSVTNGWEDGPESCVEIMTGGRFPDGSTEEMLDACVKVEDTIRISAKAPKLDSCIAVSKPIPRYANRRFSGEDIQKGNIVLRRGQVIHSSNIMPLASVGIDTIKVSKRPRVCIWSTGNELTSHTSHIRDVNGVYLLAASKEAGADAAFSGFIRDDVDAHVMAIRKQLESSPTDIMLTSGGVSVGKFDHVRQALELLGATIVFHGVSVRPGHPVLFALLPSALGDVAFFGLPGNPGAAAACFRFFTVQYIRRLLGLEQELPMFARLQGLQLGSLSRKGIMDAPNKGLSCERFRPGVLRMTGTKGPTVHEAPGVLGPAKMAPFVQANCWIHIKANEDIELGQMVSCYPMNDASLP
ncbi:hypothetical protein FGRMN_2061 [Fusarium graminum]|nr:hypothetical protein FGRMN_2061 [Fusarium graminum]